MFDDSPASATAAYESDAVPAFPPGPPQDLIAPFALADSQRREDCQQAAMLLRDMANPCRLQVLWLLCEGEMCVGAMESRVDMSQSALSQHLARLRRARLVSTRRDQQKVYYSLACPLMRPLIQMIARSSTAICWQTRQR